MSCTKCNSNRISSVTAKCSDCCSISVGETEQDGYVPDDLGIGGNDYIEFQWCLDCGTIQGNFPLPVSEIEKDITDEEMIEFFENNLAQRLIIEDNFSIKMRLVREAKYYCVKFSKFILKFICINAGRVMPSQQEFLKMYRENNLELE